MSVHYMKLERSGEFVATHMIPTSTKCDAMDSLVYGYEVTIITRGKKFTLEGYVLNNEEVQNFFDRQFGEESGPWHGISCERMAIMAGEFFCRKLCAMRIDVVEVKVGVYGSHGARITSHCGPANWRARTTRWWRALV